MKNLFITLTLFVTLFSYSQQSKIDSLKNVLTKTNTDTKKIEILSLLCDELSTNSNSEQDKLYIEQLIGISKNLKNSQGLVKGYQNYSTYFIWKGELNKAIEFILKAEKISESNRDIKTQLDCITQAGAVYSDLKQFENAQKVFSKGEAIINKNEQSKETCNLYVGYAYMFMQKEDDDSAISYYIKALSCLNDYEELDIKFNSYNGLCWLYIDRKQYEKAEEYAVLALNEPKIKELVFYESIFNRILGRIYSDQNQIQKAIKHQLLALTYFKKSNHQLGIFEMSNQLSFSYMKNKEYAFSKDYAIKANIIAKKLNNTLAINSSDISIVRALLGLNKITRAEKILKRVAKDTINKKNWPTYMKEQLITELFRLYNKKGDYKEALQYNKSLLKFKDSLSTVRFNNQVVSSETKYQTERKEKENLQLKTEKVEQALLLEKETKQKWLLSLGLISSLLVLIIGGYFYQKNKKQKEVIENLQKELHHRIKNNLAIIDTFIEVAKEEFNNKAFDKKLTELQNRIDSINEVHQQLYTSKDITRLNLKKYVETLSHNIQQSFMNDNIEIKQNISDSIKLNADTSFPIGLIINEFLTNSYKYAFDTNKGVISINLKEDDTSYSLSLKDNGKGLPSGFDIEKTESFGLRVTKLLAKQLKGTFSLDSSNGVTLNINFPKL